MESVSLPVAQGWSILGHQAAVPSRWGRGCSPCAESRGLMCSLLSQHSHRAFRCWGLGRRA